MENIIVKAQELVAFYGLKLIAAIAIMIIGIWVAKLARRICTKVMENRKVDPILISFTRSILYIGLLAFVAIAALGQLGVQTTSFIAVLGAAGLAIGLALQGSLANFAAGFLMIVFRPFKVGDYIEAGGTAGTVEGVHIFTTDLVTPDNKVVIVPNGQIMGGPIINYSAKETRRVDLVIGVGYEDDLNKVKSVLEGIIAGDSRILSDPGPTIGVLELADSSVNFAVRVWTQSSDYFPVHFAMLKSVKERFDAEGISIPYPQSDVHMQNAA